MMPETSTTLTISEESWKSHLTTDWRAVDFSEDAYLWVRLLGIAYDVDGDAAEGLFGVLSGIRAMGAGLVVTDTGVRLVPGEMANAYAAIRSQWLVPHTAVLQRLLKGLTHG